MRGGEQTISVVEVLVDVLSGVEADEDGEGFYSRLAEAVCELTGMRRAVIFRYDEELRRVRAVGSCGVSLEHFSGVEVNVETAPVVARALAEDRVIEVIPPERHEISEEFSELVGDHPVVYVPVAAAGRWPGVILAEPLPESSPLDEERRGLLWTVGKTMALASSARIATFQFEKARQLEERIDLARDIHDSVVQRLFGISMALSAGGPLTEDARARCAEEAQAALVELQAALQRPLGRMSRATKVTLVSEVERLIQERRDLGLRVEGDLSVPPDLEPLAQSVFTEALRNIAKHAKAETVVVRASRDDGVFVLEIVNDGVTKRRRPKQSSGVGLKLAAIEALQAGGLVEFGPREPGTWQVRLAVPESDGDD